jgi:hypothetical protein
MNRKFQAVAPTQHTPQSQSSAIAESKIEKILGLTADRLARR